MDLREYIFGEFQLNPRQRELLRDGHPLRLEKIPFDLLVLLVERAEDLVPREEITTKVWGAGVFQDLDASLNTAVRKLRTALRDSPEAPRYLQTIVGQGYRFVAEVKIREHAEAGAVLGGATTDADPPRWRVWNWAIGAVALLVGVGLLAERVWRQSSETPVIAVLPFSELSQESKSAETAGYFSQGITEEIITQLGRAAPAGVGVIAGSSVWRYRQKHPAGRELAADLGAGYALMGSVRREGPSMRISVRLLRTRDEVQIWADAFDGNSGDTLALQEQVGRAAARAVAAELRRVTRPSAELVARRKMDARAYDAYLRGRYYWNQRSESSLKLAIDYFRQAIELAPDYAPADAAMADSYASLVYGCYLAPTEGFGQARAALERARALDPRSAEVLASDGYLKMYFDWDLDAAERSFEEAIAANPNYAPAHEWLGVLLTAREKPQRARAALEEAARLDPGSLPIATNLGFQMHYSGQHRQAREVLRRVITRDPNFGLAHFWMGRVLNAEGDCKGALAELNTVPPALTQWQPLIAARGYVEGNCGEAQRARADLGGLTEMAKTRFVTSYGMALIKAGLGDHDAALMWLRRAVEERSHWLVWIKLDPRFAALRGDARFREVVQKVFPRS